MHSHSRMTLKRPLPKNNFSLDMGALVVPSMFVNESIDNLWAIYRKAVFGFMTGIGQSCNSIIASPFCGYPVRILLGSCHQFDRPDPLPCVRS